jgi:PmbA protein
VRTAAETFAARAPAGLESPGLIVGGDISLVRDRVAIAGSNFEDLRTDQSAHFTSSVTAIVEALDSKGTDSAIGGSLGELRSIAPALGASAVARALELEGGERPAGGTYRVLFGAQPIAEILNYMVIGSLTTGSFHAASSAYQGRFGERVMDRRLFLLDDPGFARGAVRRRVTCEGLPAKRVELIQAGRLVGLLSNFYDAHRLATDDDLAEKLGPQASTATSFGAHNGYRLGEGGGRRFDATPGAAGTNVVMHADDGLDDRALLKAVGDGVYVGRIWYTYPINGQRAGQFTCTVSGDSYLIRNGRIAAPLSPNSVRINAHIDQVFNRVVAAGRRSHPALIWGSPEAYYVPEIIADSIDLAPIGDSG